MPAPPPKPGDARSATVEFESAIDAAVTAALDLTPRQNEKPGGLRSLSGRTIQLPVFDIIADTSLASVANSSACGTNFLDCCLTADEVFLVEALTRGNNATSIAEIRKTIQQRWVPNGAK